MYKHFLDSNLQPFRNNSTTQNKSTTLNHNIQNPPLISSPIHYHLLSTNPTFYHSMYPTPKRISKHHLYKPSTNSCKSTNSKSSNNSHFKTLISKQISPNYLQVITSLQKETSPSQHPTSKQQAQQLRYSQNSSASTFPTLNLQSKWYYQL